METTIEKSPRERVIIYLDPALVTQLRRQHADERRPISRIVEEMLTCHLRSNQEEEVA